jgi:hypothetical protein
MVKKVYRTMQGREIDMESLLAKNETMPAIGNAKMNARGDELGPGGKIIRKREDIIAEYYENNPKATPQEGTKIIEPIKEIVQEKPIEPEKPIHVTKRKQ